MTVTHAGAIKVDWRTDLQDPVNVTSTPSNSELCPSVASPTRTR